MEPMVLREVDVTGPRQVLAEYPIWADDITTSVNETVGNQAIYNSAELVLRIKRQPALIPILRSTNQIEVVFRDIEYKVTSRQESRFHANLSCELRRSLN